MSARLRVAVVGGGVFGVTAALELARRGHEVALFDPGPLPHPHASSTDISKLVRMDYGADDLYTDLGELARDGWLRWNREWDEPLYHETGLVVMAGRPMQRGSYELESYERLVARGHAPERLDSAELAARFPVWNARSYPDGYFNPHAGWAASGKVVARLAAELEPAGVELRGGVASLVESGSRVVGVVAAGGERYDADVVLVAAGAWTPVLVPHLADRLAPIGQPVFHFAPSDPESFSPPRFTCFTADISRTGWYGFPLVDGVVKVGNHGPGRRVHPDEPREVTPEEVAWCREFLAGTFPSLASARLVATRLCLYSDSFDGDFFVGRDPERPGLVVASGDSGHGFKFAPVLGEVVADVVEGRENRFAERFAWRALGERAAEDARHVDRS
jgi:glycine/D-amino acid oxidase-like deaminating enzyme